MGNPANGDKKNIVKLAYLYFQEGRWDNAIEEYQKLLELDPEDINIHNMLGDVYVRKNASAQAYTEYSKVAADLVSRGQLDKAALINKKIARLERSQLSPEAQQKQNLIKLHTEADEALEENRVDQAIDAFSEILKLDSDDLIVASKLAELEEKMGRVSDAVEQYTRLGESFLKSHLFKKAQEMFKKVVTMDPQNMSAHLNLAQIYIKQGSESDAKKEYLNVAEQALAKDDLDSAFEYGNKAVELKSIEAHYVVGIVQFKKQKWAEAKNEFEVLLRFKVSHVGAQVYLAKVLAGMEQGDKAVEAFQKALKLDKDNLFALESWAEYCVQKKNVKDAVSALTTLVDKAVAASEFERAIEFARTLVSVDPKLVSSKVKLAEALKSSGDTNGAADAYYNLALVHENENKPDEAALYIKKTLELNPGHAKASGMNEGEQKQRSAEPAQAQLAAQPVKAAAPEPPRAQVVEVSPQEALKAQIGIADQYVKQGLLDEAIDIYQQLLDVDPENDEVKKKLNSVYTAYAKTGTDLTSVFAGPSKAEEEAKKAAEEAAKRAAEEATKKAADEAAKKEADEAAKKTLKELEAKAREEADKQVRIELEKRAREEADKKANEEIKRLATEKEKKAQEQPAAPIKPAASGALDEMVAIAEADLLRGQGRNEEAAKLYHTILASHPNNDEVRKKLANVEELLKPAPKSPPILKVVESPNAQTPPAPSDNEKDSNIKKKSNKIGYV
jgi:tetratricopeptide (TPR) repeat protein